MKIRAVLLDVYQTLLEVSPPPDGAAALWERLWHEQLGGSPRLSLEAVAAACEKITAREHTAARAAGILHPEVYWPAVAAAALPELERLAEEGVDEFLFLHAQLQHTVRLMPGASSVLRSFVDRGVPLGLASNAQPYTVTELAVALDGTGLSLASFQADLCFFSYKHGFSKPDPHVFRLLAARLQARGIQPGETLAVGDRADNDIEPARAQGFQTWQLTPALGGTPGVGNWAQLGKLLSGPE